jgi:hypothetical protein
MKPQEIDDRDRTAYHDEQQPSSWFRRQMIGYRDEDRPKIEKFSKDFGSY